MYVYFQGGHEKYGHLKGGYRDHHYGKKGKHHKGSNYHENKGHKHNDGHDKRFKHVDKYGKKDALSKHRKWAFKHGHKG